MNNNKRVNKKTFQPKMGFGKAITALMAVKLSLSTTIELPSQCSMIDAGIRKDCGIKAAGNDNVVTKSECIEIGCCWDTSTYKTARGNTVESPWCFYPLYYNYEETNDVILPASTTTAPVSTTTRIEVEEIIVEKVVVEKFTKPTSTGPSVLKPISNHVPATLHSIPLPSQINSNKESKTEHGDLVTAYRKKTCQQLDSSKSLNETMKALTMDRMKCNTVDFANFDATTDPNLNQDTAEGMRVLLDK